MTTITHVDVLVVGLGPAGASAAAAAASAGMRVLATERNAEPGLPVQCAEFVPMMIDNSGRKVEQFCVQKIDRMETRIEEEKGITSTPNFLGHMISREKFDRELVQAAISAGAECRYGLSLKELDSKGQAILANGEIVSAKCIIGADGPRSVVGKSVGQENRELVATRQVTVDLLDPHRGTDIFLSEKYQGGYAWLFPKGDRCNIGLGVVQQRKDQLKPLLEELHQNLVDEARVGAEIHAHTGGLIPVSGMVEPLGNLDETTILLTGDAAGLTNPVTGAGINAAVISGQLAGEAAVEICNGNAEGAEDYSDELKCLFSPSLKHALKRRTELLEKYALAGSPSGEDLRRGWVAFETFWKDTSGIQTESENAELKRMSA